MDTRSPIERYVIDVVTKVALRDLGQEWGQWRIRDGRDASGLRVDVTFDRLPIALEVTSLQDPEWLAANSEARKIERRLTTYTRGLGLAGWLVGVFSKARLRDIEAAVMPLMDAGVEFTPMEYGSQDLANAEANGELGAFLDSTDACTTSGFPDSGERPAATQFTSWSRAPGSRFSASATC